MKVAKAKGRLRGKQPKLKPDQATRLVELHDLGTYTPGRTRRPLRRRPIDDLPHLGWHATSTTAARAAIRASPLRHRPGEAASTGLAWVRAVTVGSPQAMPASRPSSENGCSLPREERVSR
jgi:hypothetical protein